MGDGGLLDREEIPGPRIAVVIKNRHPELESVERGGRPAQQRVEDLRKLRAGERRVCIERLAVEARCV